jgi:hypothetical protein
MITLLGALRLETAPHGRSSQAPRAPSPDGGGHCRVTDGQAFLDLGEIELDRRRASENQHRHLQAVLLVVDFSTTPLKSLNGPSTTRTTSPGSNMTFGRGFSTPSSTRRRIARASLPR